jgi:hypothetical protein
MGGGAGSAEVPSVNIPLSHGARSLGGTRLSPTSQTSVLEMPSSFEPNHSTFNKNGKDYSVRETFCDGRMWRLTARVVSSTRSNILCRSRSNTRILLLSELLWRCSANKAPRNSKFSAALSCSCLLSRLSCPSSSLFFLRRKLACIRIVTWLCSHAYLARRSLEALNVFRTVKDALVNDMGQF